MNLRQAESIKFALDTMGCHLADYDHQWSENDRFFFENATIYIDDTIRALRRITDNATLEYLHLAANEAKEGSTQRKVIRDMIGEYRMFREVEDTK